MVNATLRQFYPWNEPWYPMYARLVGFEGQYGKVRRRENLLLPLGFEAQNLRPIASQYTGYAIPVHTFRRTSIFNALSTRVLHISKKKRFNTSPRAETVNTRLPCQLIRRLLFKFPLSRPPNQFHTVIFCYVADRWQSHTNIGLTDLSMTRGMSTLIPLFIFHVARAQEWFSFFLVSRTQPRTFSCLARVRVMKNAPFLLHWPEFLFPSVRILDHEWRSIHFSITLFISQDRGACSYKTD